MIVRDIAGRMAYLRGEMKVREKMINRALRPGANMLTDEEIIDLRHEILEICDEIEELEELEDGRAEENDEDEALRKRLFKALNGGH